ncbi:MAG: ATP-dependent helicase [Cyanobacteria bacterium J06626_14]
MPSVRALKDAIDSLSQNPEQLLAANATDHCVVLAGPGSGKTKTLTTAMVRTLLEDVAEPHGVACITYNNECAFELEKRLALLGLERGNRAFIGTVHGFALTQIILPFARVVLPDWRSDVTVISEPDRKSVIAEAYASIGGVGDPQKRWKFAEEKRKSMVDRSNVAWRGTNPELADFIEAYEGILKFRNQIDFDGMPLLAYDMVSRFPWIAEALKAKFPVLFVDEYQDLGHALHALVLKLCFESGIRLFAVGDIDQSIYGFAGAEPSLLEGLSARADVQTICLRFNYRCGTDIIDASMAALGAERGYVGPDGASKGSIKFHQVDGDENAQAQYFLDTILSDLQSRGYELGEIGVLYRWAKHSDKLVSLSEAQGVPVLRADNKALIKRNSPISRFVERCAQWVVGGWKTAEPRFQRLCYDANSLVFGSNASDHEKRQLEHDLINFLMPTDEGASTHSWLLKFKHEVFSPWLERKRTISEQWENLDEMIKRTDANQNGVDLKMSHFCGDASGSGAINLSTFHSSKGREFRAVVLLGMNNDIIPNRYSRNDPQKLSAERREFYVAVTRAEEELHIVFKKGSHSPFVRELYDRAQQGQ